MSSIKAELVLLPLTDEQRACAREAAARLLLPVKYSKQEAMEAVGNLFEVLGEPAPLVAWLPSPVACARELAEFPMLDRSPWRSYTPKPLRQYLRNSLREFMNRDLRGQILRFLGQDFNSAFFRPLGVNSWWVSNCAVQSGMSRSTLYYAEAADAIRAPACTKKSFQKRMAWREVFLKTPFAYLQKDKVAISKPPIKVRWDDEGRLHDRERPAIVFEDGLTIYVWHGIPVPHHVIADPKGITQLMILNERNLEVRRVMMERYGLDKFLKSASSHLLDEGDLGNLFEVRFPDGSLARFVSVENSTPEKDGSYKRYVLQVRPTAWNADEAVAWTFGFRSAAQYKSALRQET